MDPNDTNNPNIRIYLNATNKMRLKWVSILGAIFFVGITLIIVIGSIPPGDFPTGTIVTVKQGTTLSEVADQLALSGVIKSAVIYKGYIRLLHDGHGVQAGDYLFDAPQSALRVAYRTAYGIGGLPKIKVTIPEGSDSKDIAGILGKNISGFASTTFLSLAKADEGYLFPDTYFFYKNTTPRQAVDEMRADFDPRITGINSSIGAFVASLSVNSSGSSNGKYSRADIVKMASIVEKEATSSVDRRIIAGILWKRLADNYPLQVDPPFFYILNKDSSQLTSADLAIDSPYNLYKNKGLPPTPIDNPGLDAILDTVNPTDSSYWYYLSDKKGGIHYSATYDGQLANKAKYVE